MVLPVSGNCGQFENLNGFISSYRIVGVNGGGYVTFVMLSFCGTSCSSLLYSAYYHFINVFFKLKQGSVVLLLPSYLAGESAA